MSGAAPASADPRAVSPEDAARARWYSMLAGVFRAPPADSWLRAVGAQAATPIAAPVASSRGDVPPLERAWNAFAAACAQADPATVRDEYEAAFLGVGKPEVFLYLSWHASGFLHERPLAELRQHLAVLGVARRADVSETEDHIAALCETMAWLIVAAPASTRTLDTQRVFFQRFLAPWVDSLVDAIEHCGVTDFYKQAGRLLGEFMAIERQAFDFESLE